MKIIITGVCIVWTGLDLKDLLLVVQMTDPLRYWFVQILKINKIILNY